jgi:chemotaxis protein CheD
MKVLHPGDVACADHGQQLATLLGSCVAVALSDPRRTIGAMCHIVHPHFPREGLPPTTSGPGALRVLHAQLRARGIEPRLCDAWVIGGGNMFPDKVAGEHVGAANVRWVLGELTRDGIRLAGSDVGGHAYRRVAWTIGDDAPRVTSVAI